jgi:TonB family protein
VGNGVGPPVLIKEVKPNYTAQAMGAKLQGAVEMEAVVLSDGSVDPASLRITRSLGSIFGLDQQAIIAVKQWRFRPGTFHGPARRRSRHRGADIHAAVTTLGRLPSG